MKQKEDDAGEDRAGIKNEMRFNLHKGTEEGKIRSEDSQTAVQFLECSGLNEKSVLEPNAPS